MIHHISLIVPLQLVSNAIGLLVRHFEQKKVLADAGRRSQLLVRPRMVNMFRTFDNVLRQLKRLAARRRLFDEELYSATYLMGKCRENHPNSRALDGIIFTWHLLTTPALFSGELTDRIYDEWADADMGIASATGRSHAGSRQTGRSGRTLRKTASVDHTVGMYLTLIGRVKVEIGSPDVEFTKLEGEPPVLPKLGERLQIEGAMYTVTRAETVCGTSSPKHVISISPPFALCRDKGWACHLNLAPGGSGGVWVMKEVRTPGANKDMQTLLLNLGAHDVALQLLRLPIDKRAVLPRELPVRAVLRMAYRLLQAMALEFSLTQTELAAHLDVFVSHTEANLVSLDISPTDCIDTVCKDNRAACMKVSAETVRHFSALAAQHQAPRYLRFLRGIMNPMGKAISRNQDMVVSALTENSNALLLFLGPEGMLERQQLIDANSLATQPRGKLAYHTELISLLATAVEGKNPAVSTQGLKRWTSPHALLFALHACHGVCESAML